MKRIVPAIILVAVTIGLVFFNSYLRLAYFLLIAIACIWEMKHIQKNLDQKSYIWPIIIGLILISVATIIPIFNDKITEVVLAVLSLMAIAVLMVGILQKNVDGRFSWNSLAIIAYPTLPMIMIIIFVNADNWLQIIPMSMISVWICDSFALGIGKLLGKKKLAPQVSPNKTWAGAIGGSISAIFVGIGEYYLFNWLATLSFIHSTFEYTLLQCIIVSFILSVFGQFGDLAASLIKRAYGVKDYSNLIPAHGGIMDKFDGTSFAVPIAVVCSLVIHVINTI